MVWTEKVVSFEHLRMFGCMKFVHVPRDKRSNLDSKAKQCIFLGYGYENVLIWVQLFLLV
jgi:hypothetical protein